MPQSGRLLLGVISGVKGIKGEVKIKTFTGSPEDIVSYGPLENKAATVKYKLSFVGFSKGSPVVRIKGVSDRNQAEALKGTELYVDRDKLPEIESDDEFYHADLIDLDAVFEDGTKYGKILRLHDFGAGDMLEIVPDGKSDKSAILVPFTTEMVPTVDIGAGQVVLNLSDDFFEVPERDTPSDDTRDGNEREC
ncbi:MAG: 16S rRNA processing protein RimM [Sneathiella sp.]|nr:16S rRNA processing protein RimM [Sneathiella sp.]